MIKLTHDFLQTFLYRLSTSFLLTGVDFSFVRTLIKFSKYARNIKTKGKRTVGCQRKAFKSCFFVRVKDKALWLYTLGANYGTFEKLRVVGSSPDHTGP